MTTESPMTEEQEYEEIVKEYMEEIPVHEEVPQELPANATDPVVPETALGKPRSITYIFSNAITLLELLGLCIKLYALF